MTISYNWLCDYLPIKVEPERLSRILTSIGLEVEAMERYEEIPGSLKGLLIGEVLEVNPHPNADKLKLTKVTIGQAAPLQIVCGAPNVAAGQKVVVATVGTAIYPTTGEPITMKVAKIRGVESHGMICAEDEIGLGDSHAGIMVLPQDAPVGTPAPEYFKPYSDIIYEIGLTPNRADAMSHWGVTRDVCAYLSHHDRQELKPKIPQAAFKADNHSLSIDVIVENREACPRYSGVCFRNVQVQTSPKWLQERLKAIGQRPINNIVDITNFIQHETGQPLHAFDYDAIKGGKVVVKNLPEGTFFKTLDEKDRKLSSDDLMICNAEEGMCIAGVFGGLKSGVTDTTKNIFLESAFFDPTTIRKTSFRYNLRTDAATRFEKGIDISQTVNILKRTALLIKEITGGEIASEIIDVYPQPLPKAEVVLKYQYLKKLSGKNYHSEAVKNILRNLQFSILRDSGDALLLEVPYHKMDVRLPADVVEEILRIDGLDNIAIPATITITPAIETTYKEEALKEKISNLLVGMGFTEILTNSLTNSKYFEPAEEGSAIKLLNNLSSELDVVRSAMLPTALEVIAFNLNRKNADLKFFEFGKTYTADGVGKYRESTHLCLYLTGISKEGGWKGKAVPADIFYLKGVTEALLNIMQIKPEFKTNSSKNLLLATLNSDVFLEIKRVASKTTDQFDIRQPVFYADFRWDTILKYLKRENVQYKEVPRFPAVERDLAMVVPKTMKYEEIEHTINKLRINKLQHIGLFDVFESEKLGAGKKSMAVNFTFLDEEKTLTDKEIDGWMNKIMTSLENELGAEIRK
ncbi:MAG: phenylalanine--tRNA ligase subunit beta [Flavisolibacter sp.]|nr:phenylalanine--tRNA ligase subunit beta [Flavisolibacter sp.]